ncbi:hypothetical protein AV650_28270 (plasmid) [Serratia fonticola]|nr:hypothetical protein AV650_28270 [Serratia fonticola]OCJ29068.1 hypothetical protein A6U95_28220 [Serratia sp. 14-2641]
MQSVHPDIISDEAGIIHTEPFIIKYLFIILKYHLIKTGKKMKVVYRNKRHAAQKLTYFCRSVFYKKPPILFDTLVIN